MSNVKSIKKNYIYNTLYQIIRIILPIITVPYVSRVLGASNIGIYSYTYSIVYYFIIFSMLGINNYGNRCISKVRDNKKEMSKTFMSIYIIQLVMTSIMIITYLLFTIFFVKNYKMIAFIQTIYLLATIFDINWFFYGLEEFKLTVIRNIIIKILTLVCIFLFVRNTNDLPIYVIIMSLSALISEMIMIPFLLKRIDIVKVKFKDIKRHIKPCFILFLPVISISLYNVMDKIMVGLLSNIKEVGYYEQSEKMISIPLTLITSLGTVMMPRISNLVSKKREDLVVSHINESMDFMMFASFPMMMGIIAISDVFVPIFLGKEFIRSALLLKILAIPIIFKALGNVTRMQYMTPHEMDKEYLISTLIGAFINLIVNFILIPKYSSVGASIGTLIAEFSVIIFMIYILKNKLPFKKYFYNCVGYFIKSLVMFVIIYPIKFLSINNFIILFLQLIVGIMIYFLLNISKVKKLIRGI